LFQVYETEQGYGMTRLDGTGYLRSLMPGLDSRELP
jgi:hypothetical protein